jgi:hypothetical protein
LVWIVGTFDELIHMPGGAMKTAAKPNKSSALHEILDWSPQRPSWQRDALRRIVLKGDLDATDILELERICLAAHGADSGSAHPPAAVPLSGTQIPPSPGSEESVSLTSIGRMKYVNRLPPDQVLPFGPSPGLNVVYGGNGAGKSSYARVLKKACRARGAAPVIRPNAYAPVTSTKASAEITFLAAGASFQAKWTDDGTAADARLSNIFVFDAFSAEHHVNEDSPAAFTPFGLDVLPALSRTCDALGERIGLEINQRKQAITLATSSWRYDASTDVGGFLKKLSATTKTSEVEALCGLNPEQVVRLADLRGALKENPLQKAKETRASAARIGAFAASIADVSKHLGDDGAEAIRSLIEDEKKSADAARAFASMRFDSTFLAGTGGAEWRLLWEAGGSYSELRAYVDHKFPYTGDEARCVLCQQDLQDEVKKRLDSLNTFYQDKSQRLAEQDAARSFKASQALASVRPITPELKNVDADLLVSPEQRDVIREFAVSADQRLAAVRQSLATKAWVPLVVLPAAPEAEVKNLQAALLSRAKTEESADDPATRTKLLKERNELEAREWLAGVKSDVLVQVERYEEIAKLEACRKDVHTAAITAKSTELTKKFVTDRFCSAFKDELKLLGLRTLDVNLQATQGKKGETRFGLRLVSAGGQKVIDIASEGERRCIALAAFLAELSQSGHSSALVFDDPVSSLDHWHREKIATRLVKEATSRQVVVFTHDVAFLNDLLAFSEKQNTPNHVLTLEWKDGLPGNYILGLPWDCKAPLDCLKELENDRAFVATKWNPQPNAMDVQSMRSAYSRLRSTMERIVEKELLDGVVCRFESQVVAGRIRNLIGIPSSECDETRRLLQKCHDLTDAHAPSAAAIPDPAELGQDLVAARKLVDSIRARKKAAHT